ncbi:MAG: hypothetical protein QOH21_1041, partial [Acidobacteriota bacterium]|nr:hypothetical protein [Acidobacteriota bacterium]
MSAQELVDTLAAARREIVALAEVVSFALVVDRPLLR